MAEENDASRNATRTIEVRFPCHVAQTQPLSIAYGRSNHTTILGASAERVSAEGTDVADRRNGSAVDVRQRVGRSMR